MLVLVECKPAHSVPAVGYVPQHEVAVELIEAIASIDESRAKASPRLVAGEAGILSCPGINLGGKHTLSADTVPQGCIAGWVTIFLLLSGFVLSLSCQLRPDGPNSMQVGLNPRSEALAELGIPAGTGCHCLGLNVATIRPKAHPDLTHSKQPNARAFVQGGGANRVHSTVGGVGRQAIAQPVNPVRHCLLKTLRVRTVPQQPVFEHLGLNAARPSAARETCSCFCNTFLIAVHQHGVKQVGGIRVGIEVIVRRHTTVWVRIPKQVDDRVLRLGVQIVRMIWCSGSPVGHHLDGRTDLAPKYHVVVLARERGGIVLMLDFHSPSATTRVEVCFLNLLNRCDIPHRIPGV